MRNGIINDCWSEEEVARQKDACFAVSRYIERTGTAFCELAKAQNLEGIVAKRRESRYYFDKRTRDWIKIKHLQGEDSVVCGYIFTAPQGSRQKIRGTGDLRSRPPATGVNALSRSMRTARLLHDLLDADDGPPVLGAAGIRLLVENHGGQMLVRVLRNHGLAADNHVVDAAHYGGPDIQHRREVGAAEALGDLAESGGYGFGEIAGLHGGQNVSSDFHGTLLLFRICGTGEHPPAADLLRQAALRSQNAWNIECLNPAHLC